MNSISFGTKTIAYTLLRADRKTLAISVEPDMSVVVSAPVEAECEVIERLLRKRAAWIVRQQRYFSQFQPRTPARQYVSGETHLYLGRQYRLRIRPAETEEVKLIGGYIYVFVGTPSAPDRVKELLNDWYARHARLRFRERLQVCLQLISGWNVNVPQLDIRRMTRRWGSYTSTGQLILNTDLIRAPRACIDYVILHEICHVRYPNHTREFYKLLSALVPDWRERKMRLERLLS
jgi:predicted metal-dependent hydrolase